MTYTNTLKDIHVFESHGHKIAFDGNSYNIALLDDKGFNVLSQHFAGKNLAGQENALKEKLCHTLETSFQIKSNISTRVNEESVISNNPVNIRSLCLNITSNCNLKCSYCFNNQGKYNFSSNEIMNENTARNAIDFLLSHGGENHYSISFFGGEPLTQFQLIKKIVQYANEQTIDSNKTITFHVTTNGVLITKEIAQFLKKHNFSVLISIDGDEAVHDNQRQFPDNSGSYQAVLHGARTVVEEYGTQEKIGIRGTVTSQHVSSFDDMLTHLIKKGFKNISIEPANGGLNNEYAIKLSDLPVLVDQYKQVADTYDKAHKAQKVSFFHFNTVIQNLARFQKHDRPCGPANGYMAVAPNGDIYPCHRIMRAEYKIGNVNSVGSGAKLDMSIQAKFWRATIENRPTCNSCWARNLCGGGCYALSIDSGQDMLEPCVIDCNLFKFRAELSIGLLVK